jgi:hypothetical protein
MSDRIPVMFPQRFIRPRGVTNAYELLTYVQQLITEEPQAYNQVDTLDQLCEFETPPLAMMRGSRKTPCGSVGSVAGHIVHTVDGTPGIIGEGSMMSRAAHLLGFEIGSMAIAELFSAYALDTRMEERYGHDDPTRISAEDYAKLGVEHIESFKQRFEKKLKSTPVPKLPSPQARSVLWVLRYLQFNEGTWNLKIGLQTLASTVGIPVPSVRRALQEINQLRHTNYRVRKGEVVGA